MLPYKKILAFAAIFFGFYLFSYLGYLFPFLNAFIFCIIILATIILTFKKLEYGILIALSELFVGGRGYLFSFNFFDFIVSIRLAIFILVFLIWLFLYRPAEKFKFVKSRYFLPFAFLTCMIIIAAGRGIYFGYSIKNIFFDLNGYLYFALLFPIFDVFNKEFAKKIINYLVSGGLALSFLTIFLGLGFGFLHPEAKLANSGLLSYQFGQEEEKKAEDISHTIMAKEELKTFAWRRDFSNQKQPEYRWSRDTGVGELTYIAGSVFRFFSSSQLYFLAALAILIFGLREIINKFRARKKEFIIQSIFILGIFGALLISFSRSLWLGLAAIIVYFCFSLPWKKALKTILISLIFLETLVIVSGVFLPKAYEIVADRVTTIVRPQTQSTGSTRINILRSATQEIKKHIILGSGFGKIISYESNIPGATGILKVFTFEWQYLEIALKMGLIGLIFYIWFILKIFHEYRENSGKNNVLAQALMAALIGFLIVNITTPYLNHPLGIGLLSIIIIYFSSLAKDLCP